LAFNIVFNRSVNRSVGVAFNIGFNIGGGLAVNVVYVEESLIYLIWHNIVYKYNKMWLSIRKGRNEK